MLIQILYALYSQLYIVDYSGAQIDKHDFRYMFSGDLLFNLFGGQETGDATRAAHLLLASAGSSKWRFTCASALALARMAHMVMSFRRKFLAFMSRNHILRTSSRNPAPKLSCMIQKKNIYTQKIPKTADTFALYIIGIMHHVSASTAPSVAPDRIEDLHANRACHGGSCGVEVHVVHVDGLGRLRFRTPTVVG